MQAVLQFFVGEGSEQNLAQTEGTSQYEVDAAHPQVGAQLAASEFKALQKKIGILRCCPAEPK